MTPFPPPPPDLYGPLVPGRAYRTRNGVALYCFGLHSCSSDIALNWGGSEGWNGHPMCYHHERLTGRNHSYMGYGDRACRLDFSASDIVTEEMIVEDLRAAWEAHEREDDEQRAEAAHA